MKPAPFEFVRPGSLDEALRVLAANPDAKVLAGGQSLVPLLSMRLAAPAMVVDINGIPGLDHVSSDESGVRVGALARHAQVESDPDARRVQPLLSLALQRVAHATIRNRGTTVGSIVHADPSGEMPAVISVLEGSVTVAASHGTRDIAAADLFGAPMESTLRHDEIAVEAHFPALPQGAGVAFDEVSRRHGDYALCGVAAVVGLADGLVASVRAGYLSVSDVPVAVDLTPAFAAGEMSEAARSDAADLALGWLSPEDDIHASAAYRRQLVRTLTGRVVDAAYQDALRRSR